MKKLTCVFITYFSALIFHGNLIHAQNPTIKVWDYRYGGLDAEYLSCFMQTTDGGYMLGGFTPSDSGGDKTQSNWGGSNDFWIVKTDPQGIMRWNKDFGGSGLDALFDVKQTRDGGYIIGGYSDSGISGNKTQATQGSLDYWIIKLDSLGNQQWDKDFGGTGNDLLFSLQQTTDNGYILGGFSNSGIGGDKTQNVWGINDYWIVKTDSLGNFEWDADFGGTGDEWFSVIRQVADGGYIIGGYSDSGISGDKTEDTKGFRDYWIVKIDSSGNKLWDKDFGGTFLDMLVDIRQTTDGGYILGGNSYSDAGGDKTEPLVGGNGDQDYWIVKTDSLGIKQWDRDFGGTGVEDEFNNLTLTSDGGYLIGCTSYSPASGTKTENNFGQEQAWIIKVDSLGNPQWDKTIFTNEHDESGFALQASDGCYVIANATMAGVAGYKTQPAWNGLHDYWIVKFCDSTIDLNTAEPTRQLEQALVYPNPAGDKINIQQLEVQSGTAVEISVYNIIGDLVYRDVDSGPLTVDCRLFPPGMYWIEIKSAEKIYRSRFIRG